MSDTAPVPLSLTLGEPTGVTLDPDLWGIFLEDINWSLDGGLNAELLRNGDFEFTHADRPGWGPLTAWQHTGEVEIRTEDPVHPHNGTYVRLTGPVTLTNEGFDAIRVEAGARYRFSAFTWRVQGVGEAALAIVDAAGEPLAQATLATPEGGWHEASLDLVAERGGLGRLRVTVPRGLTLELDALSLRPCGSDGEPLTFRQDLVDTLRALEPSFVRFPGGCVAHGLGLGNLYHWKQTVGPREERVPSFNTWGYHQSRQIGYLEYFELCELLGATPMPIVAAGVSCQNLRGRAACIPMEDMPAYVQDILDLVEFANGGPDTRWGARRAELGHPEPFGLRWLGLGNEDEITRDFEVRYAMVAEALASQHPEVTVIGTAGPQPFGPDFERGWEFAREQRVAVVDEHAYRTPRWFHQNLDRYDDYDREGPAVYFGEYAARTNSVRSALAEAAFMITMERNGDIVRLASYAPLLARLGTTQWVPDLIYFDADDVLPSASYHVQRMFSVERGEAVVDVALEGETHVPVPPRPAGNVRLAAPGARVRVDDASIDGAPVAPVEVGESEVELGAIGADGVVELTATRVEGSEGMIVRLGGTGTDDFLQVDLGSWQNKTTVVHSFADGISNDIDGPYAHPGMSTDVPMRVRIALDGPRIRVWVDDELRHDLVEDRRPEQRVVAGCTVRTAEDGTREHVLRLVNATDRPRRATFALPEGGAALRGVATVLAGADPDAGQPFEASPVEPREVAIDLAAGEPWEIPAWSFTVAVLRAG
ncbi:alpha-L-arabinofuranosidase C-terminal domain-containing protein [Demequina mangrovi]|uniref:non-reducing end alpha-L-arabinofuranosidase n=1 Tax=Demequina mangrovi TaxID=1043493 RepID=A0A1H7AWP9_9MICO|nr:alpha-L-arabinofuranosidase C-terminal domain-containing protein [Demequina mangrovi]SEJ65485.1 Alpha-L-arabinofuranosidase C-terminus [Demequina mangrovi]